MTGALRTAVTGRPGSGRAHETGRRHAAGAPSHVAMGPQAVLLLQRQAGNAAVTSALRSRPSTVQRDLRSGLESLRSLFVPGGAGSAPGPASVGPDVERRVVTDADARHRGDPPELRWTGARFLEGTAVLVHRVAQKAGRRYQLVTQMMAPGVQGPPLRGWTLATNLSPAKTPEPVEPTPDRPITPEPTSPAPATGPAPATSPAPAPAPTPAPSTGAAAGGRGHEELPGLIEALEHPFARQVGQDLARIQALSQQLLSSKADRSGPEEVGADRDRLVAAIAALRTVLAGAGSSGLDRETAARLVTLVNRALNELSPYYAQSTNMDVLEGKAQAVDLGTETSVNTRTCNITSVSMALEALGKSSADHDAGRRDAVVAAATVFSAQVRGAAHTVGGAEAALAGLRLPDFVQLAAIAHELGAGRGGTAVREAARRAWARILSIAFLATLAESFGAHAEIKDFDLDTAAEGTDYQALHAAGKHRSAVEKLTDKRNQMEAATGAKRDRLEREYDRLYASMQAKLRLRTDDISVAAYRQNVLSVIGPELDAGAQIVVYLRGHYVRLQAVHADHVVVDDPGQKARANRKVTYEEARAMAYFKKRLVITG
ncbi:hypothetical protein ACH9D2_15125 [Kocuria sp. M4R2S49]|uniref:hypothetical protein n=1 Tax=Kocuria rhizosphaericola TaxID=3376284 RepID=UPI0037934A04